MEFSLVELVKVGGPLLGLAALALVLMDRHIRTLLTQMGNHLTHVDDKLDTLNSNTVRVVEKLDQLIRKE